MKHPFSFFPVVLIVVALLICTSAFQGQGSSQSRPASYGLVVAQVAAAAWNPLSPLWYSRWGKAKNAGTPSVGIGGTRGRS